MSASSLLPLTASVLGIGLIVWPYLSETTRIDINYGSRALVIGILILLGSYILVGVVERGVKWIMSSDGGWLVSGSPLKRFIKLEFLLFAFSYLLAYIPTYVKDEDGDPFFHSHELVSGIVPPFFILSLAVSNFVAVPMVVSDFALSITEDRAKALGLGVATLFLIPLLVFGGIVIAEEL